MDAATINVIIAASAGLLGALIGGGFTALSAYYTYKRQIELQQIQFEGQMKLKARELMFNSYQKNIEDQIREIKQLGGVVGQLGLALNLPDTDEQPKLDALINFTGTVSQVSMLVLETVDEIEIDLKNNGLLDKWEKKFLFVKTHLSPNISNMSPEQIKSSYMTLTKALAYIAEIQTALVEARKQELFGEYLPTTSKSLQK